MSDPYDPRYLYNPEFIPYQGRMLPPTSGKVVPDYVGLSYANLMNTEFFLKQRPINERRREREIATHYTPDWWFNNTPYLPFEWQQPGGFIPDTNTHFIDTRMVVKKWAEETSPTFSRETFAPYGPGLQGTGQYNPYQVFTSR